MPSVMYGINSGYFWCANFDIIR